MTDKEKILAYVDKLLEKYHKNYYLLLVAEFIDSLPEEPVSKVNHEYELSRLAVEALDRKRICPTLRGGALHKFKNEWHTIKQIMHWWDTGKEFLNYRLALHWISWGAQNLNGYFGMSKDEKAKMDASEEPVSEDLEVEVMEYSNTHNDECFDAIGDKCQFVINAFKAGAKWQKEQLMEDSVNATIEHPFPEYEYFSLFPDYRELKDFAKRHKLKDEDEVKVIIIKDE